jgi:hypothetical protein
MCQPWAQCAPAGGREFPAAEIPRFTFYHLITNETQQAHFIEPPAGAHCAVSTIAGSLHHGQEPHPVPEGLEFA